MPNPFLARKDYILPYAAVWVVIAATHSAVLFFLSDRILQEALTDALVFNIIYAGLGLSIWFAVRYHDSTNAAALDTLLYHLATAVVTLSFWLGSGYFLLRFSLPDFESYRGFLEASMVWRGISGLLIYSLLVLIYYLYIQGEERKDRKKNEAALQLQVREAEIDRIKAQINPHFLFNSLNSIASLTVSSPESAREMLVKLSNFLRYSFEYNENELTNLATELEHSRLYLAIEQVRFGERLSQSFDLAEESLSCKLPNIILQPLFENAVKHGVYESLDPVKIHTETRLQNKQLVVKISNSFDPEAPPRKGKGMGIKLVANRLSLVYQLDNLMHVEKAENIFTVTLIFPQNPDDYALPRNNN